VRHHATTWSSGKKNLENRACPLSKCPAGNSQPSTNRIERVHGGNYDIPSCGMREITIIRITASGVGPRSGSSQLIGKCSGRETQITFSLAPRNCNVFGVCSKST